MSLAQVRRAICSAMMASSILIASAAPAETLAEAVAQAYRHNPAIEASRARTRASDERIAQAKAQFGPSLSASASYGYNYRRIERNAQVDYSDDGFGPSLSANMAQPIFTSGRLSSQLQQARARYGSTAAALRAGEIDLLTNVVIAYVGILREEQLVAIARENVALLGEQREQIDARYEARFATETDLEQTRTRLASGEAELQLAEGNLLASRNAYRNLVGHYPDELQPLPPLPALPRSLEEAQELGLQYNPVAEAARFDTRAARAAVGVARGSAGPQVTLQGLAARTPLTVDTGAERQLDAQARVELTMPLFTAGLNTARIREAIQLANAARQTEEQVLRDVREDISNAWDRLSAARRALPPYAQAVTSAQTALTGAREQQRAGQLTALDVLDTARDLLASRRSQAELEAQLYVQHALILAATGQLTASRLAPGTPDLGPEPEAYRATPFAGLPTGPLVEGIDGIAASTNVEYSPVQKEGDSEAGHDMAPAPSLP